MKDFDRSIVVVRALVTAAALLAVLWVGYGAATHRRYETINGIAGELTDGERVGQTFEARYDGLAGVEFHLATLGHTDGEGRGTLNLTLRAGPGDDEVIARDSILPGRVLEPDQWYLFEFDPVEGSKDKSYYVEIEAAGGAPGKAISVLWYQPLRRGDPYANGAAYRNGAATQGDLTFGVKYQAPLAQVWGGMIWEAGEYTSGWVLWLLVIVGVGGAVVVGVWGLGWIEARGRGWGLGVALGLGLVHGLLYMLIMPPWQGPDEYAHYAYAALLDKHDLDNGKVEALDLNGADKDMELVAAVNASADRNEFTRRLRGNGAPGAATRTDASLFQQVRQPPTYYWLCAVGLRAARAVGIAADPDENPEAALYVMRGVSVALSLLVIGMAWLAVGVRAALGVALFPMHAFVGGIVNNDIMAGVAVSALFLGLVGLVKAVFGSDVERWPSRRGLGLAGLCALLAAVGVAGKATAPAAAVPLLLMGLGVWAGAGITRRVKANGMGIRMGRYGWAVVGVVLGMVMVGGFFILFEQREDASAGWFKSYVPLESAKRVASGSAHDGRYVVEIDATQGARVAQRIVPPLIYHPALKVTVAGWVRLEPGQAQPGARQITPQITVMDGAREAGFGFTTLSMEGRHDWARIEVSGDVEANAEQIEVILEVSFGDAPGAMVQFDDLTIKVEGILGEWNDPVYKGALVDPSGEQARWTLRPFLGELLPEEASRMVSVVLNPQTFSKVGLWSDYARGQWLSFWGSFGWLSIYLPPFLYMVIGLLVLIACGGLVGRGIQKRGAWGWQEWLGLGAMVSLVTAIGVGFAKQAALTAYGGLPSGPQGRYLFVLIVPVAWLGWVGLNWALERVPLGWGRMARGMLASLFAVFWVFCLLALVLPYYFG